MQKWVDFRLAAAYCEHLRNCQNRTKQSVRRRYDFVDRPIAAHADHLVSIGPVVDRPLAVASCAILSGVLTCTFIPETAADSAVSESVTVFVDRES